MFSRIAPILLISFLPGILLSNCAPVRGNSPPTGKPPASIESQLVSGASIYARDCATSTCHGTQGEGLRSSSGFTVWPLVGDEFQIRHPNAQIVFDVVRSGSEANLRALTDQQLYDAIAYQFTQNQLPLDSPLTEANAFDVFGGKMTGDGKGGLYPPPEHAVFLEPPLTREPPINGQDERLRLCIDQFAEASAIGNAKPSDGGVFLILVIALTDLGPSPIQVDPGYLSLATPGGEPLRPQSSGFRSAIEKFHAQTIYPQHGTVGMVVFTLPAPDAFEQLIYNDGVGNPLILPLTP